MTRDDFPAPTNGFVITHFLVVSDQDRSRDFYKSLFDAKVLLERDPVIMKVANTWLILNEGGEPTDDKPTVTLETPPDPDRTSAFLNVRVADINKAFKEWSAKGAEFRTEPKDHGREIRAYIRDPDGHLIEVGQTTGLLRLIAPQISSGRRVEATQNVSRARPVPFPHFTRLCPLPVRFPEFHPASAFKRWS